LTNTRFFPPLQFSTTFPPPPFGAQAEAPLPPPPPIFLASSTSRPLPVLPDQSFWFEQPKNTPTMEQQLRDLENFFRGTPGEHWPIKDIKSVPPMLHFLFPKYFSS
jgi:hypothetical protein